MLIKVIGCGSIGQRHIRNLVSLGHDVIGVDPHDERRSQALLVGAKWIGAMAWSEELCQPSVPAPAAVFICTPAATHADVAADLLAGGYAGPLFVEKPIATSTVEAAIFTAWPHPVIMVGYNWRFNLEIHPFTDTPILWAHFECQTNVAAWPGSNYTRPMLECSHEIDLALLTGAKFGTAGQWGASGAYLQFHGPDILIDLTWRTQNPSARVLTYGGFRDRCGRVIAFSWAFIDQSYEREIEYFLACVAEQRPPFHGQSVRQAIDVVRTVENAELFL